MRLKNKVAIVTGGGQGIGKAIALKLAQEGAAVMLAQRTLAKVEETAAEIRKAGGKAIAMPVDIRDFDQVNKVAQKAASEFGGIDILVNNAAFYGGHGHANWDTWPVEQWKSSFDINVLGGWNCAKAAVPFMRQRGKGKIVNISTATVHQGYQGMLPYTTTKAGVCSITRGLAKALGRYNICVNCLAIGYVLTEASLEMQGIKGHEEEADKAIIAQRCIRRSQYPEDVAGPVLFFASDEADFVTGQTLVVDGGVEFTGF
jgi:3-oxoacyl-[acyl-carrier protein] reductase